MTKKLFFVLVLLASFVGVVNAQVTTAAMSGQIMAEGDVVIGANIVAVHEPSGTTYGAVTNLDGRYTIQGMRTGGPYTVKVSYIGYKTIETAGISLELGNTFRKDVTLASDNALLSEVVVTAAANTESGASSNFSLDKITSTPTVDRSVYDVVKNMPMASTRNGGITFAGSNNRYNSFQIDGSVSNDVFGLSSGGTNGSQTGANPISMEAVQEIQVVIAPFDVRQGGFTGGGINAITKQGDNTFHASAYTYYTNQNLYGTYNANTEEVSPLDDQQSVTYGGTLSGAFIKNKLFFFANVEQKENAYPINIYPGYDDEYISEDLAKSIADKYAEYTGIQESYAQRDRAQSSLSMLARIDWNIDNNNKLAVRYQGNDSFNQNYSASNYTYTFANSGYNISNKTNAFVAELTSRIGEDMHNELRGSATYVRDIRDIAYKGPNVSINGDDATNGIDIAIGTEYSSGANYLNQDIYMIEDNFSWYKGDHTLTFGTHNEFYKIQNQFIQAAYGSWSFDNLEAFMNNDPSKFIYKYNDPTAPSTGGNSLWAPTMNFAQFGLYGQDKWDINNNFELTYGIRLDLPVALNAPTENKEFNEFAAANGIDSRVGDKVTSSLMVSPRVGFRWFANDDHNTLLRGGSGIFTGRVPFVWVSNSYTNTGIEQKGTTVYGDDVKLGNYTAAELIELSNQGSAGKPDIVTVDGDFKFPQVWRSNLALEHTLPGGIDMTLEAVYSKTMNNVLFENIALTQDGKVYAIPGVEASAIPKYTNNTGDYNTIINLKNTNKGYTYALSALFEKSFDFGLNLSGSYTYSRAMSVNDGTSSVAYSNWKYNYSVDPNSANDLGYSKFDNPHSVMLQASYTTPKYLNGLMQTNIGVVYNGYSGSRYCLTLSDISYKADHNGDGYGGNTLLYIPTADELEKMNFTDIEGGATAAEQRAAFGEWIENDSYASQNRGQYAERYSNLTPWQNQIDLHIGQDIFCLKDRGSKVQITFDITNFANMLNKEWGAQWSAPYNVSPIKAGFDNSGNVYYNTNSVSQVNRTDISSRWHAQVGAKFIF